MALGTTCGELISVLAQPRDVDARRNSHASDAQGVLPSATGSIARPENKPELEFMHLPRRAVPSGARSLPCDVACGIAIRKQIAKFDRSISVMTVMTVMTVKKIKIRKMVKWRILAMAFGQASVSPICSLVVKKCQQAAKYVG